jgi:Ca-activated chloride channel family protein
MDSCHLLRPDLLWLLLPLALLLWLLGKRRARAGSWRSACDPQLLPYLLQGREAKNSLWPLVVTGLGGLLAILALSGPTCEELEQPVFRQQSALVIALDLSRSMDATDIKPSRLQRAKLKLIDILKQRREGQTALVVYAADAYTVAPLTDDSNTIISLVGALDSNMMPQQGSRADTAIAKAAQLLQQAGDPRGDILLITDGVAVDNLDATLAEIKAHNYRVSVLSVGTPDGAPIALRDGGFLKDTNGAIVIPKLDESTLQQVVRQGKGRYHNLSADDTDIRYLLAAVTNKKEPQEAARGFKTDQWREAGPWLLLLLAPLAALVFRRGYLAVLVLLLLPLPDDSYAATLWRNDDQQAYQQLQQGNAKQAAEQFQSPEWRAAAHYRAGDYQETIKELQGIDTAEGDYNRGNALARLGSYQEAIKAYDKALKLQPDNEDAKYNRDLVKKQLQKQQQQQKQQQDKGDQSQQDSQADSKDQKQGQGQQQRNQSNKQQNSQGGDQQQNAQQKAGQQQNGQQQDEQQQKKQDGQQQAQQQDAKQADQAGAEQQQSGQQNQGEQDKNGEQQEQAAPSRDYSKTTEKDIATEQWLRRIPDDPGGLLRRKFQYQYQQQAKQRSNSEIKPW